MLTWEVDIILLFKAILAVVLERGVGAAEINMERERKGNTIRDSGTSFLGISKPRLKYISTVSVFHSTYCW